MHLRCMFWVGRLHWCVRCMLFTVEPMTQSGTRRNAIVFLTLYLQLLGMSDAAASALMALFLGGSAVGGLLGGWLGDKAAQASALPGAALTAAAMCADCHCCYRIAPWPSLKYLLQLVSLYTQCESASELVLALRRGGQGTAASSCARPVCLRVSHSRYCCSRYIAMPVASARAQ